MRRLVPVLAGTAGGLALLANFHTEPPSASAASGSVGSSSETTTTAPAGRPVGPAPAPTTTAPSTTRTVNGPVEATDFGDVQVAVVLNGSKIVDVKALQLPNDRQRSARISAEAGPLLRQEALRAQSANIDLVSGATYTSDGYVRSLEGALARAGL